MNCSEFRRAYSDFADGLLDEHGGIAAHRHLSECLPCRRTHEAFQRAVHELRRQPKVLPSADFAARLERRLAAEYSPAALTLSQGSAAATTLVILTLAAAALFALDMARRAAPPAPVATTGPLPVLGANVFRTAPRSATHGVARSPFAASSVGFGAPGWTVAPVTAEAVGSPAGR